MIVDTVEGTTDMECMECIMEVITKTNIVNEYVKADESLGLSLHLKAPSMCLSIV